MAKIRVEFEVTSGDYCDNKNTTCPACCEDNCGRCYCAIFDEDLETDANNGYYCKRCDKCKQAEE